MLRTSAFLVFWMAGLAEGQRDAKAWREIEAGMKPYTGEHRAGVDATTLTGKVMCGYQGWFAAEGDGSGRGWVHFGAGREFAPGKCTIDLWPDVSGMEKDELYPTPFRHQDGSVAQVFSSANRRTVLRHFAWMQQHGIDGVFLQRFGSSVRHPDASYRHRNLVAAHVREGANRHGRTWAMMYDLSGLKAGEIESVVMEDWKRLVDHMQLTRDKAYLHHKGKPVVAVWGIGFGGDKRPYSLKECEALIDFLKNDPEYGGNTVMIGIPSFWREQTRDAVKDKELHRVIAKADIISPWTVGRYHTPEQARRHAETVIKPDIEWAKQHGIEHLPVIFPGFSWQNLKRSHGEDAKLGAIPRLKGEFLWAQATAFRKAGAGMLYVAMFDEIDEGTAIFKCSNDPPVGESKFLTYDGLPSDHYLWLTGQIGKMLRAKEPTSKMPSR